MESLRLISEKLGQEPYDRPLTIGRLKDLIDEIIMDEQRKNLKEVEEETLQRAVV